MMATKNTVPPEMISVLGKARKTGRYPRCMLITGGTAASRRTAAEYAAAAAECTSVDAPCGKCRDCKKVKARVHPDVEYIEAGGKSQTVRLDDVKSIKETCYKRPGEGRARVYIIPEAGKIRTEGQNSLLKLIEEPPENVCIILCCEVRSAMLPTVLSRLYEINLASDTAPAASVKAEQKAEDICRNVVSALCASDGFAVAAALAPLDKDRGSVSLCAGKLRLILRDALTESESVSGMPEQAAKLEERFTAQKLFKMNTALEYVIEAAARNANTNLLLYLFASGLSGQI